MRQRHIVVCWAVTLAAVLLGVVFSPVYGEEIASTARVDSLACDIRVTANRATVRIFERVTILKPAGERFGSIEIWTSPLVGLNSFSARLLDVDGKPAAKYGKSDLVKVCGFGAGFEVFSEECRYVLNPEHRTYPYSIESSEEGEFKTLYLLPDIDLDYRIPIRTAIVRLSHPANQPICFRSYQLTGEPETVESGGQRILTWRFVDLAPVKEVPYATPETRSGRRIALAAEKFELEKYSFSGLSWKNVGLFIKRLGEDPDFPSRVPAVNSADSSDLKRVADSLYRNVTEKTRYVAAYVGIGGWQPHSLAHIRHRQYGDCKDLSALLVADLRASGITAYPCLLMTNDEGATDSSFVNFVFNHVITMAIIGSDTLWYDPTCSHCPPGELRRDDEGVLALIVTDTGGVLMRTPLSPPQANRIVRVTEITADSAGRIALKVHATASGHFASSLRASIEHKNKKELDQYIAEWLVGSRAHFKVTSYRLSDADDISRPVQLDCAVSCAQPLEWINRTKYFLPFLLTSRNVFSEVETEKRETDVWLGYPWEVCDSVTLRGSLIAASEQASAPADTVLTYPWVRIAAQYSVGDSTVAANLTQTYVTDRIPVFALDEFKSYISRRRWVVDQPIKFVTKAK